MPISFDRLTRAILQDGDATKAEAELLTRLADAGDIKRPELDAIIDLIDKSDVGHDKKKEALRLLTSYKEETAGGVESALYGMDSALSSRLARQGVETCEDLLYVAARPAQRFDLADQVGVEEKTVRQLVKQADLQRLDGVDPMLARVLLDAGIDSVPELARRSATSLHKKLKEFSGTRESWIMQFKCPSLDDVKGFVAQAKDLPKVVEFGDPMNSLASMGLEARAKLMIHEDGNLDSTSVSGDTAAAYLDSKGLGALKDEMRDHQLGVLETIASNLEYHGVDVTAEGLLDGTANVDSDNDDMYYEFNVQPRIEEWKGPGGEEVGTTFHWSTDDGSEGEYWTLAYDAMAGKFSAMYWSESANGDSDFSVFHDDSAPIDLDRLSQVGRDLNESWGDENIQDGVTTLKAEKAQYGWSNPSSFAKSLLTKHFEDDSDHRWDGWVSYHDDLPLTPSALTKAARAVNAGFQYADESEVGRIRGQIDDAVKELGDPAKITYGSASGKAIVEGINNGEPVDCQIHLFVNRDSGAYVATISRGGSLN